MTINDLLVIAGAVIIWFVLTRVVFPKMGIPTCCCGGSCETKKSNDLKGEKDV